MDRFSGFSIDLSDNTPIHGDKDRASSRTKSSRDLTRRAGRELSDFAQMTRSSWFELVDRFFPFLAANEHRTGGINRNTARKAKRFLPEIFTTSGKNIDHSVKGIRDV